MTAGHLALELMHEIGNPLETLGNLTYLTLEAAEHPEQVRIYMHLVEEQLRTLRHVAGRALGFARLSESPRAIDLVELAEAALRIHQRTVQAKRIHLFKQLPSDLIAEVHSGQLLQVVSNLLANALEALPEEGSLSIRLRRCEGCFSLTVADNGSGIHPDHFERVFDPFFTTKGDSGNGLGLSLSKRLIEEHGGNIRFRSSVHPDRHGTAFRIFVPANSSRLSPG